MIKQPLIKFLERFSELIKNISDIPKSDNFVYFTKITAVTWSIDEIIPVSMALENIEQSIWHAADLYSVRISCSVFTWPNI